jgi:uncharacterized membrane protein required for colicin V production
MFSVAIQPTTSWSGKLPFSWFDILLLLTLAFGFWRGRKHGISREFLPTLQWLVVVVVAGLGCDLLAPLLLQHGIAKNLLGCMKIFENNATENGTAFGFSYVAITVLVVLIFSYLKRASKAKIENGNLFGGSEYYLGMVAGVIRYACITIFVLALLNAPFYSAAEIQVQQASDKKEYGGGTYSGNYIPRLFDIQDQVFKKSLTGPFIKDKLSALLIHPTGAGTPKKAEKAAKP